MSIFCRARSGVNIFSAIVRAGANAKNAKGLS